MLFLKLPQHLISLRLITRRQPLLLLPLIVHHLLNHTPRLAVQITQLAILRFDLRSVYLGRIRHDVSPPLHLIGLVEVNGNFLPVGSRLKGPS